MGLGQNQPGALGGTGVIVVDVGVTRMASACALMPWLPEVESRKMPTISAVPKPRNIPDREA